MIEELLAYNRKFVEEKRYEQYAASKYPNKKIAILTCMDTRLVELLPAALGLRNGDVKIIKNAGGVVTNPFGSVIRSLLVAIIELGVEEIMVIGHTDCGVQHIDSESMIAHMKQRGVSQASIDLMKYGMSNGEFTSVCRAVGGFEALIDPKAKDAATLRYLADDTAKIERLLDDPKLMRTPVVRNGKQATVGYCPEVWETWE